MRHDQRGLYEAKPCPGFVQIKSNGVVINSEQVLQDWLNAYEYHLDEERRERIQPIIEGLPDDFVKDVLIGMLMDKAKAIRNVGWIVAAMLGNAEGLPPQLRPGMPQHVISGLPTMLIGRDTSLILSIPPHKRPPSREKGET